jgi:hypothetical protein
MMRGRRPTWILESSSRGKFGRRRGQKVFDLPVASDPGGELGAGRGAGRQAGDQVDAFDGELVGGEVLSPADDLEVLAGVGLVDVGEGGGLQPPDLQAVVGFGCGRGGRA